MSGLNELRDRVHNLAIEKGWHQDRDISNPHVLGSMLALIHSEVSEALEDVRTGDMHLWFDEGETKPSLKPSGLPAELADIIIRTLDLCGALVIDIEQAVELKHAYTCTRSHRHGNKAL
jgi:NTP pyrophosphatase (non-canonical NTP hydrolase)